MSGGGIVQLCALKSNRAVPAGIFPHNRLPSSEEWSGGRVCVVSEPLVGGTPWDKCMSTASPRQTLHDSISGTHCHNDRYTSPILDLAFTTRPEVEK